MARSRSPSARWSSGSNPSAAKSRGRADLAQDDVVLLPAGRRLRLDDVVDPAHGGLELVACGVHLALQGLDAVGELARVRQQTVPLLALGTRDLLAEGLLLCARALELGERRAPPLVGREHGVDQALVGSPGALAGADGVRILTEVAQVDHVPRLVDGSGVHARTPARGSPPTFGPPDRLPCVHDHRGRPRARRRRRGGGRCRGRRRALLATSASRPAGRGRGRTGGGGGRRAAVGGRRGQPHQDP